MRGCTEMQAYIAGEGRYRCICGQVRLSPLGCGSVVQTHIKGFPGKNCFYGLLIEQCGRHFPLPPLLPCSGEALMSVYTCSFCPEDIAGGQVIITTDPCSPCCTHIACGRIVPCIRHSCCPPDPRPLFGAPPRPLPGGSIFC